MFAQTYPEFSQVTEQFKMGLAQTAQSIQQQQSQPMSGFQQPTPQQIPPSEPNPMQGQLGGGGVAGRGNMNPPFG